jgi:phosphinothricin acetyltransferase
MIRKAKPVDTKDIVGIYNHYVLNSTVTFEEEVVSVEDMGARIANVTAANLPWLVAEEDGLVIGYAYATNWKARSAYRHSVESSVYLATSAYGQGYGSQLYTALLDELKMIGIHAVMGGICLPNPASVRLHEKFGMTKVAHFKQVGFKFGEWVDVGYWQLVFE